MAMVTTANPAIEPRRHGAAEYFPRSTVGQKLGAQHFALQSSVSHIALISAWRWQIEARP